MARVGSMTTWDWALAAGAFVVLLVVLGLWLSLLAPFVPPDDNAS